MVFLSLSSSVLYLRRTYRCTTSGSSGICSSSLGLMNVLAFLLLLPDLRAASRFFAQLGSRHRTVARSPSLMALL